MSFQEYSLYRLAKEKERMFLKEAEAERLRKLCKMGKPEKLRFWSRLASRIGDFLIILGYRLKRYKIETQKFF